MSILATPVAVLLSATSCAKSTTAVDESGAPPASTVPLMDLGSRTYLGFSGGLYEGGSDSPPQQHAAIGAARARTIQPRDANGTPSPDGKIVMLSIGMSNTSQNFCGVDVTTNCVTGSFMQQASASPLVNHTTLVVVNGAQGGMDAGMWTSASARPFDVVRDERLARMGVTEQQVQVVWMLEATKRPTASLPAADANANQLEANLGDIVRAMRIRYPNLQQVFISSREYGGYATTQENPEPFAYETGFAVKWLVQAQIDQMRNGGQIADTRAGNLDYNSVAPWIAWGPDLWANGATPRSDGFVWLREDFKSDGTHPSVESGVGKVGTLLFNFFSTTTSTRCWFLGGHQCP